MVKEPVFPRPAREESETPQIVCIPEEGKRLHRDLLLLGDEQWEMVERYLSRGEMFALQVCGETRAVCVVTREGADVMELKNIAVLPAFQRRGYGRRLVQFVENRYAAPGAWLYVGTGDSPDTLGFYHACGFCCSHVVENFFLENYDHPIFEGGKQLKDMVYLKKKL